VLEKDEEVECPCCGVNLVELFDDMQANKDDGQDDARQHSSVFAHSSIRPRGKIHVILK
jgi:hypothetical protein